MSDNFFQIIIVYQVYCNEHVIEEVKRIIEDSDLMKEDDALWPPPDRIGRQVFSYVDVTCLDKIN